MNILTKKGIIAVSANALATTVKLGLTNGFKTLPQNFSLFGFEFAKSFVTSTLPALAVNATPDFFANKYANFGVDAVESAAITGALGVAEWKLAPEFLKSSYKFSYLDADVNVVNTFVQAEAFNYFTQDDLSPELNAVDTAFAAAA